MKMFVCGLIMMLGGLPLVAAAEPAPVAASAQGAATPFNEVKRVIDEVVRIATDLPGEANTPVRREKLRNAINPYFDFNEMAKRSLGIQWKKISAEEQREFVEVFSDLLARTYLQRIETVKPGMVRMESEKAELPKAIVRTIVISRGDEFPIDYKLYRSEANWKVYDVVIENIGLVANYRNEFAGIIRRDTFAGLLKKLREKNAAAA